MRNIRPTLIDVFSGCGGLSLGLMGSGWRGLFAIEKNADAFKTLKHNLVDENDHNKGKPRFLWPDWVEREPYEIAVFLRKRRRQLESIRGEVHLVVGGPPCQGFSFAGKRTGNDPRNELFKDHLRLVDIVKPEFVLMENVQGIHRAFGVAKGRVRGHRDRPRKSYARRIRDMLGKYGYEVQQHIVRASDFGVPQFRARWFILGIRQDLLRGVTVPDLGEILSRIRQNFLSYRGLPVRRPVTVAEAISDLTTTGKQLVECRDGESPPGFLEVVYDRPLTNYQRLMHGEMDGHSLNSLRLVNHRPETVARFIKIVNTCRKGIQLSEGDRARLGIRKTVVPLAPDRPSHTLTTLPDDLLHYAEPRVHTVREYARLQSFPDWFEFRGRYTTGGPQRARECPRYTQVGNAVPPLLAEIIGEALCVIIKELRMRNSSIQHATSSEQEHTFGENT